MKKKSTTKDQYNVIIRANGTEYTASGKTIQDAFVALGLTFQDIKTKGEVIVSNGQNTASRLLTLMELRRALLNKILLSGLIRNLERLLV